MKYFNFFFLVCRARYEDAKFFYEMDTRKKFSEFRSQLKGILFHVGYFILYVFMKKMIYLLGIREFVVVCFELESSAYNFFLKLFILYNN
jgi:hypothetical protein